jgi:medium-chain acyl-[acyl-carrier-protein] hydrolase
VTAVLHATTPARSWLVRGRQPAAVQRLFCFAYAGGSAAVYAPWQAALGPQVEVCALQLPGRGGRMAETPLRSLPEVVRQIAAVVAEHDDLPFTFFGHSLGALLAFEVARYSRTHGLAQPRRLIVSGSEAPTLRQSDRGLHLLPDPELKEELRNYNGTPPAVLENDELMELVLPMLRADFELVHQYCYQPAPPLGLPLLALAGVRDPYGGVEQMTPWLQEAAPGSSLRRIDGDHFFIHSHQQEVLDHVGGALPGVLDFCRKTHV